MVALGAQERFLMGGELLGSFLLLLLEVLIDALECGEPSLGSGLQGVDILLLLFDELECRLDARSEVLYCSEETILNRVSSCV